MVPIISNVKSTMVCGKMSLLRESSIYKIPNSILYFTTEREMRYVMKNKVLLCATCSNFCECIKRKGFCWKIYSVLPPPRNVAELFFLFMLHEVKKGNENTLLCVTNVSQIRVILYWLIKDCLQM